MKINNSLEFSVLEELKYFHSFNILTDKLVETLTAEFKIDCKKLCEEHGITYTITEDKT